MQFDYPYYTPFQYAGNKPISFIDLDGAEEHKKEDDLKDNTNENSEELIDDGSAPKEYYQLNNRGFYIEGSSANEKDKNGGYLGNTDPRTGDSHDGTYLELERINGILYHKYTRNPGSRFLNWTNELLGGDDDLWVDRKKFSVREETRNDVIRFGAEWVLGGMIFKSIGGLAGQLLKKAGGSIWKLAPLGMKGRGFVYEKMLGLKGLMNTHNFPKIDAFYKGVATSVKTMDIFAKKYIKSGNIAKQLKTYVDDLFNFTDTTWGGQTVLKSQIKKSVLEVGIPRGATKEQIKMINIAIKYAEEKGIKMNVRSVK